MNKKPNFVPVPHEVKMALSPQALKLLMYLRETGSVTQRDALLDLGIQSLTRRVTELRAHYEIFGDRRKHKVSQQRYVRYFLKGLRGAPAKPVANSPWRVCDGPASTPREPRFGSRLGAPDAPSA